MYLLEACCCIVLIGLSETGALYQGLHGPANTIVCMNQAYHLQGKIKWYYVLMK